MTNSVTGRRSGRGRAGGEQDGFELMVDIARAVADCKELCGCGHSDPRICFLTVKERKSLFLRTHHSLLLQNPRKITPPIKVAIKQRLLSVKQTPAVDVTVYPLPAVSPVSVPVGFPARKKLVSLSLKARVPAGFPAPGKRVSLSLKARVPANDLGVAASTPPRAVDFASVQVDSAAHLKDLPLNLKARVSAAVGGEGVCDFNSKFGLVIKKKLTESDLNPQQSRLSIPWRRSGPLIQLLRKEELSELRMGGKIKLGFFVDPDLEIASPTEASRLVLWKVGNQRGFMVNGGGWKWVMKEQSSLNLKKGDEIELWSFRTVETGELCFVLVTADTRRRAW